MTQNFNPAALAADVADLCTRVAALEKAILSGNVAVAVGESLTALDDVAKAIGEFVPRLNAIEESVGPILPLVPKLLEMFSGDVAGVGGTQVEAEKLGSYSSDEPAKVE